MNKRRYAFLGEFVFCVVLYVLSTDFWDIIFPSVVRACDHIAIHVSSEHKAFFPETAAR